MVLMLMLKSVIKTPVNYISYGQRTYECRTRRLRQLHADLKEPARRIGRRPDAIRDVRLPKNCIDAVGAKIRHPCNMFDSVAAVNRACPKRFLSMIFPKPVSGSRA